MEFEVLAEGLAFPEGPVPLPDGSVLLVEIQRGALTRVWNGKAEIVANLGGGPNGAAVGPDGAVYIANNGGFTWLDVQGLPIPIDAAPDYTTGRIERVELSTGKVERLYESVNGLRLSAPNDLVFDRSGNIWFTDYGHIRPRLREHGGLYFAKSDGSSIVEAAYGFGLNGVGLSPDEGVVYASETATSKLWAFDVVGEGAVAPPALGHAGRCVCTQPDHVLFDSLAVQADGAVCVATLIQGGITTITPEGKSTRTALPDPLVTNIAFGGPDIRDAYITLSGTGKLIRARWPSPGRKLNFVS